ncbi:DUF6233 domain-containing protein [Streptomyces sp. NPDC000941]
MSRDSHKAGPWVRDTMPDGQELDLIITGWTRTPDGQWWCEAEALLPTRYEDPEGRGRPMGAPTPITLPADDVTPIPEEEYALVPGDGAIAGRQWVLEKPHRYVGDDPSRRLHRRDCWQARTSHTRITTAEAAELVRNAELAGHPDVAVCDVCRPDRAHRNSR